MLSDMLDKAVTKWTPSLLRLCLTQTHLLRNGGPRSVSTCMALKVLEYRRKTLSFDVFFTNRKFVTLSVQSYNSLWSLMASISSSSLTFTKDLFFSDDPWVLLTWMYVLWSPLTLILEKYSYFTGIYWTLNNCCLRKNAMWRYTYCELSSCTYCVPYTHLEKKN